jgi:hypothetical protein
MKILAIDTSADETSVAITEGFRVLSSTIASQIKSHNVWGGIVPSIAKLAHVERIEGVVVETIRKARRAGLLHATPSKPCFACDLPLGRIHSTTLRTGSSHLRKIGVSTKVLNAAHRV